MPFYRALCEFARPRIQDTPPKLLLMASCRGIHRLMRVISNTITASTSNNRALENILPVWAQSTLVSHCISRKINQHRTYLQTSHGLATKDYTKSSHQAYIVNDHCQTTHIANAYLDQLSIANKLCPSTQNEEAEVSLWAFRTTIPEWVKSR